MKDIIFILRMTSRPPHKNYLKQLQVKMPKRMKLVVGLNGWWKSPIGEDEWRALKGIETLNLCRRVESLAVASQIAWERLSREHQIKYFGRIDDDVFISRENLIAFRELLRRDESFGVTGPLSFFEHLKHREEIAKVGYKTFDKEYPYKPTDFYLFRQKALYDVGGWDTRCDMLADANLCLRMIDKGYVPVMTSILKKAASSNYAGRKVVPVDSIRAFVKAMIYTYEAVKKNEHLAKYFIRKGGHKRLFKFLKESTHEIEAM